MDNAYADNLIYGASELAKRSSVSVSLSGWPAALLPGAEQQIYEKISDITISMKSADHLQMPELINSSYMVSSS